MDTFFGMDSVSKSKLDDQGQLLSDLPPLTEHKLCILTILVCKFSRLTKNIPSMKATVVDKMLYSTSVSVYALIKSFR